MQWEPTLQNTYKGIVVWPVPENHQVTVTLFKDQRSNEFEDKDWSFVIEDVSFHIQKQIYLIVVFLMINIKND